MSWFDDQGNPTSSAPIAGSASLGSLGMATNTAGGDPSGTYQQYQGTAATGGGAMPIAGAYQQYQGNAAIGPGSMSIYGGQNGQTNTAPNYGMGGYGTLASLGQMPPGSTQYTGQAGFSPSPAPSGYTQMGQSGMGQQYAQGSSAPSASPSGYTQMRAPNGDVDWVHPDHIDHYTSMGATRL